MSVTIRMVVDAITNTRTGRRIKLRAANPPTGKALLLPKRRSLSAVRAALAGDPLEVGATYDITFGSGVAHA